MIKKWAAILLVLVMCFGLVACANSTDSSLTGQVDKPSYEELESQLEAMTKERDSLKSELDTLKANIEEAEKETTVQDGDVTVLVTVTPKNPDQWIFSNYVNFVFSITNNTAKDIQGIQGELNISDLFGAEIMTVGCDFTGETITAGATITNDDLSFECNEFIHETIQ